MTDSQSIPISSIRRDGGTQPRAAINREAVSDYMASMAAGAEFPPVIVFYDGADYWLADGFHRIQGAENAGRSDIACEVYQGTKQDAQWYSFGANKANGLRRTNRDKQRALRAALTHDNAGTLSDHQLAVHVGVDVKTVGNWRVKLTMEIPQSTKRKGRDGRTIDVTRIGKAAASEQTPVPLEAKTASPAPAPRTARAQKIEQLTRSILSFVEVTKHLAHLVGWVGEAAGEFEYADQVLTNVSQAIAAASAEIERKAVAADPLNAFRLEIQEKNS